jgi:hypothetical protein
MAAAHACVYSCKKRSDARVGALRFHLIRILSLGLIHVLLVIRTRIGWASVAARDLDISISGPCLP